MLGSPETDFKTRHVQVSGDPGRKWKGMVEVRHKGKKSNKDAISENVPCGVLQCVPLFRICNCP